MDYYLRINDYSSTQYVKMTPFVLLEVAEWMPEGFTPDIEAGDRVVADGSTDFDIVFKRTEDLDGDSNTPI